MTRTSEIDRLKAEVAATARMMAAARLVDAFGHASARLPGGGFLMTSTAPLLTTAADTILTVGDSGETIHAPQASRWRSSFTLGSTGRDPTSAPSAAATEPPWLPGEGGAPRCPAYLRAVPCVASPWPLGEGGAPRCH